MDTTTWLTVAQRLQALAQTGLEYSQSSPFDMERYAEIRALSGQLVAGVTEEPLEKATAFFTSETGCQTPRVDVRAVVRGTDELLMVQEKTNHNRRALPGGWA